MAKEARRRRRADEADEPEPRDVLTGQEAEERLSQEELGGESEYSVAVAGQHERERTGRFRREPEEPLSQDPDELGRRFLEDASQAPALVPDEDEEVRLPGDEDEEE